MESLDELLDFASDIGEEEDDMQTNKNRTKSLKHLSSSSTVAKTSVPGEMSDISSDSSMSARIERLKAACRAYNGSPDSSRVQSFSKNPDEEATVELVYSEQGVEVDQPRKAPDVKVAPNPPQMPVQLPPKVPSPRLLPPSESPRPLPPSENRPSLKRPREVIVLSDSESDEI